MSSTKQRFGLASVIRVVTLMASTGLSLLTVEVAPAAAAGGSVSDVVVQVSPQATGYPGTSGNTGATYSISFIATDGISEGITVDAPAGTRFASFAPSSFTDHTNPADDVGTGCGVSNAPSIWSESTECQISANPGDSVTLSIDVVTNPSTASDSYTLQVATDNDPTLVTSAPYRIAPEGYWLVGSDGGIFSFGSAQFYGSTGNLHLNRPVVGITPTSDFGGYWLDASDGGVFSFGDTQFYGSIPGLGLHPAGSGLPHSLNAPIVGMVPSVDDHGYFMVASDGGVFAFGDAKFEGSCPGIGGCTGSAVAVMPDASGDGYWLVTSLGAVYAFGDAKYLGAPGNTGWPITSAVRTPDGGGYWILDAAGDVHGYGDAANLGSVSGVDPSGNGASAIFTDIPGDGYGVVTQNGTVVAFGGVPDYGGMQNTNLNGSIIAATGF